MILRTAGIFVLAAAVTSLFYINFCATLYQCGCQSLWEVADRYCNIHNAHGKHCPWCSFGKTGYAATYGSILLAQLGAAISTRKLGWLVSLGTSVLAFPLAGLVLVLAFGWYTGYWN